MILKDLTEESELDNRKNAFCPEKRVLDCSQTTMNSRELNVNVPLATGESDSEEFEVNINKSDKNIIYNLPN